VLCASVQAHSCAASSRDNEEEGATAGNTREASSLPDHVANRCQPRNLLTYAISPVILGRCRLARNGRHPGTVPHSTRTASCVFQSLCC
jgi:hypothetical protein